MPKGKAATTTVVEEEHDAIDALAPDEDELPAPPVGRRTTKTVSIKTEALAPDEDTDPRGRRRQFVDEPQDDELPAPLNFFDDPLDDFFNEDEGLNLVEVYRNPTAGGSPRGGRMSFVAQFTFTDSLLADIQTSCGGGSFTILQRGINEDGHKGILRRRVVNIEGAPKEYSLASANAAQLPPVAPVAATAAMPAAELPKDETRVWFNDLTKRVLEKSIERALDPPTTAQATTAERPPSLTAQLAETTSIITAITRAAQQIAPPAQTPAPSSGWIGDLASLASALGLKDFIAPVLHGVMSKQLGEPVTGDGQSGAQQTRETGALPPHHELCTVLVDLMMRNEDPPVAVSLTIDFAARYAEYAPFVLQLRTLSPVELLERIMSLDPEWALLKKLPYSAGWLQDYQEALNAVFEATEAQPASEATASAIAHADAPGAEATTEAAAT